MELTWLPTLNMAVGHSGSYAKTVALWETRLLEGSVPPFLLPLNITNDTETLS